jgi:outer membrane lipoprotein LolB
LSRDALGEDVPLGALPFWLKGQAWPGASSDASIEPLGFVQLGWQIDTSRLQADAQLEARRASPPAVLLRVRLDR